MAAIWYQNGPTLAQLLLNPLRLGTMTSAPNSELGLFIDEPSLVMHHLMNLLGVNDAELGEQLGLSRQSVHALRTGRSQANSARLKQIAAALGVPTAVMMTTPAAAIRWVLDNLEAGNGDDGGEGAEVTTLQTPAGVVQWPITELLDEAA